MKNSAINGEDRLENFETPREYLPEKSNLDGDRFNTFILIILYILQGFIVGFSTALPIILQSRKIVTYGDQALFSITLWPHFMKVLWAPLVDALYVRRIGKRKSWIIPLELLMVTFFLYTANNIENWLPESGKPNLKMIIFVIFTLNFLTATHDIVVDGWALTMLKKRNVNYASTCNSVGLLIGMFIGNVCFTLLVSEQFGNKIYLRSAPNSGGLITMQSFLFFWAFVVSSVAFFVGIFKKEKRVMKDDYENINVLQSYKLMWDILKQPAIKVLAIALMTAMVGFITTDSVSPLKLVDAGVSKDDIMIVYTLMYGVKFLIPVFISKYVASSNPMDYYMKMTPFRLLWGLVFAAFVYFTPRLIRSNGDVNVPMYYYLILGFVCMINEILSFFMLLVLFAFFCQISDPRFGGTYMTLFGTLFYIGWLIPNTLVLKLVGGLTFSECSTDARNTCTSHDLIDVCKMNGGGCMTYVDGYYIVMAMCVVFGFIWYCVFRKIINKYQLLGLFDYAKFNRRLNTETVVNEPCIVLST